MKTRLLAFAILAALYVGGPLLTPDRHTAFAQTPLWCYCDYVGDKYADGGGGTYTGTAAAFNQNVGLVYNLPQCRQACWDNGYAWAQGTVCASEDLWYVRTTTYSWLTAPVGPHGEPIGGDIPCPE